METNCDASNAMRPIQIEGLAAERPARHRGRDARLLRPRAAREWQHNGAPARWRLSLARNSDFNQDCDNIN